MIWRFLLYLKRSKFVILREAQVPKISVSLSFFYTFTIKIFMVA